MEKYEIKKPEYKQRAKRVGRGRSSGIGKTSGRGHNGQLSRSGSKKRAWFEGGQMPIQRRIPKRGFNNNFSKVYQIVNISQLEKCSEGEIDQKKMKECGMINKADKPVKILGSGEINIALTVIADAFSSKASEKIQKAGGKSEIRKYIRSEKKD